MPDLLADRIAALEKCDMAVLRAGWAKTFGRPAPMRLGRDLLLRALAWHLQAEAEGGLSKAARRRLAHPVDAQGSGNRSRKPATPRLRPGTRLVREWHGETHHVTVSEDGFDYRGARYRSLSRIAREITGTRWSGPRFFGLRNTRAMASDEG